MTQSRLYRATSLLLFALIGSMVAYVAHLSVLQYITFILLVMAMVYAILAMKYDLDKSTNSAYLSMVLLIIMTVLYLWQRAKISYFYFNVLDASDYYLAGVSSVLRGDDVGNFLPLSTALSATGFQLFGYKYAPIMTSIAYFPSLIWVYFLLRKMRLAPFMSYAFTLLFMSIPLNIWISKTPFSEGLWQMLLLIFLLISYQITAKKSVSYRTYIPMGILLILLPLSRGEGILVYGLVFFIALYHLWKFHHIGYALLILSGLFWSILGLYISLKMRATYLLEHQFSRLIPDIDVGMLIGLVFMVLVGMAFFLLLVYRFKRFFHSRWFPLTVVVGTWMIKITFAWMLSVKKHILVYQLLYMNEYSFMLGNLGFPLTFMVVLGLILLHLKALKGDRLALLFVLLYTVFYIPFMMQNATFSKEHEFFLYWSRYYFSILMVVHLVALGMLFGYFDRWLKNFTTILPYTRVLFLLMVCLGLSVYSLDTKMYAVVTKEGYLENSYKLFPWLQKHIGKETLSVVYATDIKYRNYGVKQLMRKGFHIVGLDIPYYRQVRADAFAKPLELPSQVFKRPYILCLSQLPCQISHPNLELVDMLELPVLWRNTREKKTIELKAYLYRH